MDEQVSPGLSMTEYLFFNPQRNEINFPYGHHGKLELGRKDAQREEIAEKQNSKVCFRCSNYPLAQ